MIIIMIFTKKIGMWGKQSEGCEDGLLSRVDLPGDDKDDGVGDDIGDGDDGLDCEKGWSSVLSSGPPHSVVSCW